MTAQPRNNTSYGARVNKVLTAIDWTNPDSVNKFLRYHQIVVREVSKNIDSGARGLLLAHDMGMGKTMIGVALAFDFLSAGYDPILLVSKSLSANIRKEIRSYITHRIAGEPEWSIKGRRVIDIPVDTLIDEWFSFVSSNASNMITQMLDAAEGKAGLEYKKAMMKRGDLEDRFEVLVNAGSLENKVLIVDEAHNLFRAITNGSSNAIALYDIIMKAKNIKIFFLTGTPISNDPFEVVPCFHMLTGQQLFPTDYTEFRKIFTSDDGIINKEKFQNRIMGLVSRVTAESRPGPDMKVPEGLLTSVKFPTILPRVVEVVPMSDDQYAVYFAAREKELEESSRAWKNSGTSRLQKPKNQASSSYRQQSRQLSNWCPPVELRNQKFSSIDASDPKIKIESTKYERVKEIIESSPGLGYIYSQFVGAGGLGSLTRFLLDDGWSLCDQQAGGKFIFVEPNEVPPIDGGTEKPKKKTRQQMADERLAKIKNRLLHAKWWQVDNGLNVANEIYSDTPSSNSSESDNHINNRNLQMNTYRLASIAGPDTLPPLPEGKGQDFSEDININLFEDNDTNTNTKGSSESTSSTVVLSEQMGSEDLAAVVAQIFSKQPSVKVIVVPSSVAGGQGLPFGNHRLFLRPAPSTGGGSPSGKVPDRRVKKFAVISGEVDEQTRNSVLKAYNSPENKYGELCSLLLFSATGAEGLDLKNQRYGIVLEPYWTSARIDQVEKRGARAGSHDALLPTEQTFGLHIMCASKPATTNNPLDIKAALNSGGLTEDQMTTDLELYLDSKRGEKLISSFTSAIYETSIECSVNDGANCYICSPTDEPLFTNDLTVDLLTSNKCVPPVTVTVKVNPVVYDGTTYFWSPSENELPTIYEFNKELNSYIHIEEYSPLYSSILKVLDL